MYRPRVGFYPLLIPVVPRGCPANAVPSEQFPNTPIRIHEDTPALQPLIVRWCDRRGHPLAQERQGSHGLSRARGGAHAVREGLSEHGAASFQKRARYQEGRKVRGSRQARAISKRTRFGRKEQEAAWKNAESRRTVTKLLAAGVSVPRPYGYFNDTLIMELVTDAAGDPAPRLGDVDLSPETAREYHRFLIQQVVLMLSIGLIHGDLSEFNVLVGRDGPVIIDLPQAVNAAANNGALAMLERDVNNIRGTARPLRARASAHRICARDVGAISSRVS